MVGRDGRAAWSRRVDDRSTIAPVPLLSALIDGAIAARRDMTAGGARYRTFGMLAEARAARHRLADGDQDGRLRAAPRDAWRELCDALEADFEGYERLRALLLATRRSTATTTSGRTRSGRAGDRRLHRDRRAPRRGSTGA